MTWGPARHQVDHVVTPGDVFVVGGQPYTLGWMCRLDAQPVIAEPLDRDRRFARREDT